MSSPLVIDLANQGIDLRAPKPGVAFDIDADGASDRISWTQSTDAAFLVRDKNRNGRIDDGDELFGNYTRGPDGAVAPNGFEALAVYDTNGDYEINAEDKVYSFLRLWRDGGRAGQTERGELQTLESAGIQAIDLRYVDLDKSLNGPEFDEHGNATRQRSVVRMTDGTLRMIFDIWFTRAQ
jgi:hypothetical protein